jgi:CHAT domain-containing protein
VVEPPIVEPPVVEPPIVEPPVVEPPIVESPVVEPPIVEPPVVENNRPVIPNDLNIVLTGNENDVSEREQPIEEEKDVPELPSGSIAYNPNQFSIVTLEQVRDILSLLAVNTDEKPALVYVSFTIPEITARPLTDQELAQKEAKLTNEYADFLNLDKRDPNLVLSIEPSDNYELELILITQDEKPFRVQLSGVTRQKVLEKAESLYNEVYNLGENYRDPASELYLWIFASLEDELEKREVENILFFLPSGMRLLPLSALYDPNQQEYVAEKDYTVGVAPSMNLLDYRYQPLNQAPVLAFGASEFAPEEQQTPLPGVGVEIPLITEQIRQGNAFLNQAFTLDQFQNRQANTYPIVHLATHADFLIEAPKQSYIQLYNKKLRLTEWRELNLDNPTVDLLVISACKTAYGNAEVELGFGGLAVQAGVKTVIASLWEVGDVGTIGLMSEFYESLEDTSTKARALQLAQQAMIEGEVYKGDSYIMTSVGQIPLPNPDIAFEEDLSHPYYWAAFTLIGSPW